MTLSSHAPAHPAIPVKSWWSSPVVAAAETLVILASARLLQGLGIDFHGLPINPYLACVILMSAQHGVFGGILSASLAIALTYAAGLPAPILGETYFDFIIGVWTEPLVWLTTALAVGVITTRRVQANMRTAGALERSLRAQTLIEEQYNVLASRARRLERRIAGLDGDEDPSVLPTARQFRDLQKRRLPAESINLHRPNM